jgi:hypothetical protein
MLDDAGITVERFRNLMKVGKNTPHNWFASLTLPDKHLLRAAQVLRMDIGNYFPRLAGKNAPILPSDSPAQLGNTTQSAEAPYDLSVPTALPECQRQLAATQQKLIETLEKYNNLLVEHNQVLRSMARSITGGGAGGGVAHSLHNAYVNP